MRWFYLALACLALTIAFIGIFLPGLPTTEFVLISVWAAGKSSERLHHWVINHRLTGPIYYNWHHGKVIALRHKIMSAISMSVCMAIMVIYVNHLPSVLFTGFGMLVGAAYIWSRPSVLPETPEKSTSDKSN